MSRVPSHVSRRDFLCRWRVREGERDRALEISCRTLFMRCSDAAAPAPTSDVEHEPWMGEPPAVLTRRTVDEILSSLESDLAGVTIIALLDADWLDAMPGGDRMRGILTAFTARGGKVERQ